jgi:divalent metal cation (Fe/Co/Zn/Cd) transporter
MAPRMTLSPVFLALGHIGPSLAVVAFSADLAHPPAALAGPSRDRHLVLARRARMLSWLSLIWIGAEGGVAILAGVMAGSTALIGFGADSAIEGLASVIIIWRFTGSRMFSDIAEGRAQKLVAIQFFLLAPYVAIEALRGLITGAHADPSWLGIGLAVTSAVGMPVLGIAKRRIGAELGSIATRGEGAQNVLCGYLAVGLLLGLLGNALFGLWWLDPVVALGIAAVAVREGRSAWRGEECCAHG